MKSYGNAIRGVALPVLACGALMPAVAEELATIEAGVSEIVFFSLTGSDAMSYSVSCDNGAYAQQGVQRAASITFSLSDWSDWPLASSRCKYELRVSGDMQKMAVRRGFFRIENGQIVNHRPADAARSAGERR